MSFRIALVSLVLAIAPAGAFAHCGASHTEANMTCASGTHWDGDAQKCVPSTSS
jgi:hypothetical protein